MTVSLRTRVAPEQNATWPGLKQGADPHGPFGPVICAWVFRLSRSLSSISLSSMPRSVPYGWLTRLISATLAEVTFAAPK